MKPPIFLKDRKRRLIFQGRCTLKVQRPLLQYKRYIGDSSLPVTLHQRQEVLSLPVNTFSLITSPMESA